MDPSKQLLLEHKNLNPTIYAYTDTHWQGMIKIGYTTRDAETRIKEQYPIATPTKTWKIIFEESAIRSDGSSFDDHDIHKYLKNKGIKNPEGEWFECSLEDLKAAYIAVKKRELNYENRINDFKMRPEQERAVEKTFKYFNDIQNNESNYIPKFLWNCKMRFGKTFASYQLAKKMGFKKVLIMTFKPAILSAWKNDLETHIDFKGWKFVTTNSSQYELESIINSNNPIVCFGSFQDFLQLDKKTQCIKSKNTWVHQTNWDLVIFDEYHFGAWRENAKNLFGKEFSNDEENYYNEDLIQDYDPCDDYNVADLPIQTQHYLYLSGTPFRALNIGEFIEEQIFTWTYTDEQEAKKNWVGENNPYESLPRMVMMCYQPPENIIKAAMNGEFNEFNLNEFFKANGKDNDAKFVHENDVQQWLNLIRGINNSDSDIINNLKQNKVRMPYHDTRFLDVLQHTLWFLPSVSACFAMKNLLNQKQNKFYQDYKIIVCAGHKAGIGSEALDKLEKEIDNPVQTKSITLTCGKLTTGVTVKCWTGIFMLRNLSSPETYFQAAFRVQSPWEIHDDNNKKEIMKKECFIFDFSLNRALKQISDYSINLDPEANNPKKQIEKLIQFLPVLAYQGANMDEIDADKILDFSISSTTATLLAKQWKSNVLINIDNATLTRLLNSTRAIEAISKIEEFRMIKNDIETIISKSQAIRDIKKEASDKNLSNDEKKELKETQKEYRSLREKYRAKLIKLITRIPVFMYLTDYREQCLKDVILKLEPALFKKVTGIEISDFELLVSLELFNNSLMNEAIWNFRGYEDKSLEYTGINKQNNNSVGGWDKVKTNDDK